MCVIHTLQLWYLNLVMLSRVCPTFLQIMPYFPKLTLVNLCFPAAGNRIPYVGLEFETTCELTKGVVGVVTTTLGDRDIERPLLVIPMIEVDTGDLVTALITLDCIRMGLKLKINTTPISGWRAFTRRLNVAIAGLGPVKRRGPTIRLMESFFRETFLNIGTTCGPFVSMILCSGSLLHQPSKSALIYLDLTIQKSCMLHFKRGAFVSAVLPLHEP